MAARKENQTNLSRFFSDEYQSLKGFVRSRLRDTADRDAEDIVQEVALRMFSRADELNPIQNIGGYVYRALRNKIVDALRAGNTEYKDDFVDDRLVDLADLLHQGRDEPYSPALQEKLRSAVASLKPIYREIILAVDFEGYTFREVSEETGISMGTLMSRRHRALSILYSKLNVKT